MKKNTIQYKKGVFFLFTMLFFSTFIFAQESAWEIPDDKKQVVNPLTKSADLIEKGAGLYQKNCQSCHGEVGTNSALPLMPDPGDPAAEKFQSQTSGSLYYKITTGQGAMPSFKKSLSDDERWTIVSFIKSFGDEEEVVAGNETEAFSGSGVRLKVELDEATKKINAILTQTGEENNGTPANGIAVEFFVKRNFGLMAITDGAVKTNDKGYASAQFPEGIRGNKDGAVQIVISLKDKKKFGEQVVTDSVSWADKFESKNILDQRALWAVSAKAPLWIIFSYLGAVIAAWSTLFYVVYQIFLIKKLGDASKQA